jgi:ferredoxin-fold anticodon binding domain-containing protein
MEVILKIVTKLLDKFLIPEYHDIYEYHITSYDEFIEITFWMHGTDDETEEEIVDECDTVLSALGSIPYRFIYRFTTEGDDYSIYK